MNRLQEIMERKAEIRSLLEGDQEVNMQEIQEELRQLQEEEKKLNEKRSLAESIQLGQVEAREIQKPADEPQTKVEVRSLKWNDAIGTQEYRSAWAKEMMGQALSNEERSFLNNVNEEYRAFTHNTENTQILIPKTVATGIWERAEELHPLWADVNKMRVRGELSMLKKSGETDDARWYTEDEEVETDRLQFGQAELTGCELAKAIQVTWKLKKMAIQEFEAYIIREIGRKMGIALATAVYQGRGKPGANDSFKPEPYGIRTRLAAEAGTPQMLTYSGDMTYRDMTTLMGKIHSSYVNGAVIYANNTTIWNHLANIVDGNGRPMFVSDVQGGGVGRILGRTIKPDAGLPEGVIMLANVGAGYTANINEDITMYREEHVRRRLTDYMGYAIVDGDVLDNQAFVILSDGTPEV